MGNSSKVHRRINEWPKTLPNDTPGTALTQTIEWSSMTRKEVFSCPLWTIVIYCQAVMSLTSAAEGNVSLRTFWTVVADLHMWAHPGDDQHRAYRALSPVRGLLQHFPVTSTEPFRAMRLVRGLFEHILVTSTGPFRVMRLVRGLSEHFPVTSTEPFRAMRLVRGLSQHFPVTSTEPFGALSFDNGGAPVLSSVRSSSAVLGAGLQCCPRCRAPQRSSVRGPGPWSIRISLNSPSLRR